MKIYSMTATFGKLEHQTLTLEPELNVIHAPNEWGKSTWCAFLVAMLYGIDTRERTTQTTLADKERYAPWSGSPMSGRMDLHWNGRDITIERRTKGRSVFGEFSAYETHTGLPVPELTASNCGKELLGVEKSVFTRAGFIRFSDLPVTDDESLRRRLNALVTTGDESSASDALAQKLKDLKNRCRHNKTGQLPQAESQRDLLTSKLEQLHALQERTERITQRQTALEEEIRLLENHRDTLAYEASRENAQRVADAQEACRQAEQQYLRLKEECETLPSREAAQEQILQLEQLRMQQDALQEETLPPLPEKPECLSVFPGLSPEQALRQSQNDKLAFDTLTKPLSPAFLILGCICAALAVGLLFRKPLFALPAVIAGVIFLVLHLSRRKQQRQALESLTARYPNLPPEQWVSVAEAYQTATLTYTQQEARYRTLAEDLQNRKDQLASNIEYSTCGASINECLDGWRETLDTHDDMDNACHRYQQAKTHAEALAAVVKPVAAPAFADALSCSAEETRQRLIAAAAEKESLHQQKGQCEGQMTSIGQEADLNRQLNAVEERICKLEDIYNAVTLAQQTLETVSNELQRKFAPRISQRAQTLFAKLTDNRYDRLRLGEDLTVQAATAQEDTLRSGLWRSDGTADQLYLALRLAVAEELTPHAPLILDDALVRFDDTRLSCALDILKEAAGSKQILLFTCQQRESQLLQ